MTGYVYAIGDDTRVKIGWSANPRSRLSKINSDNHEAVRLIGVALGSEDEERALHDLLSAYRLTGEWFRNEGLVRRAVSMFAAPSGDRFPRKMVAGNALRDWRMSRGMSMASLAGLIVTTQATISRIERGVHIPRGELMGKIAHITGGEVTANDFLAKHIHAAGLAA